jgi:hypothetical protein
MKKVWTVLFSIALAAPAVAQTGMVERTRDPEAAEAVQEKLMAAMVQQKIVGEVRARTAVEGRITPNAPYSAEAFTESTQVLADGNRISRKSVTRVYRDGEGRTRREEIDDSGTVVSVSIVDPVAHVTYVLNPSSRTAYRDAVRIAMPGGRGTGAEVMRRTPEAATGSTPAEQERVKQKVEELARMREVSSGPPPPPPPPPPLPGAPGTRAFVEQTAAKGVVTESLGQQTIEGITTTGSRSTTTIPAGAIGNLQPIKIVVEQWFSSDLGVLVMTKHSDPRVGDTIYRLQSIVRAEPDRSLFTLPPDYTLKESGIRPQMREQ